MGCLPVSLPLSFRVIEVSFSSPNSNAILWSQVMTLPLRRSVIHVHSPLSFCLNCMPSAGNFARSFSMHLAFFLGSPLLWASQRSSAFALGSESLKLNMNVTSGAVR